MNIELIKQFAEVSEAFKAEKDVMSISIGKAHVTEELLIEMVGLENVQITNRGGTEYPYKLFVTVEGIELFALAETKSLAKYPQFKNNKEHIKEELKRQLAELEKEEEATA